MRVASHAKDSLPIKSWYLLESLPNLSALLSLFHYLSASQPGSHGLCLSAALPGRFTRTPTQSPHPPASYIFCRPPYFLYVLLKPSIKPISYECINPVSHYLFTTSVYELYGFHIHEIRVINWRSTPGLLTLITYQTLILILLQEVKGVSEKKNVTGSHGVYGRDPSDIGGACRREQREEDYRYG